MTKGSGSGGNGGTGKKAPPLAGKIRRSQLVGTFGPGSLVDLLDHAVLMGGLEFWNYPKGKEMVVTEPRLREKLAERLARLSPPVLLSQESPFREPPSGEQESSPGRGVQVLEMPEWFVCQGERCRALLKRGSLEIKSGHYQHRCADGKTEGVVPVRFVAACRNGHLQEFPWVTFAHSGAKSAGFQDCPAPRLRFEEGVSGDFSEVRVSCDACGASQGLSNALIQQLAFDCGGHRPWLGRGGQEECAEKLRLLVRSASNSYFAQVVSALSIPDPARMLEEQVETQWHILATATAVTLPAFRTIPAVGAALAGFSDAEVLEAIAAISRHEKVRRPPIRSAEMVQLRAVPIERPGELPPEGVEFFARAFVPAGGLPTGIGRLVLAPRLREVRVQVGFNRLEPVAPDLEGEYDLGVQSQRLSLAADWLPACEIRGEGLLVELDAAAVAAWEQRPEVIARDRELQTGFKAWAASLGPGASPMYPGIRFYLLHSLSHLLITAISLHCGYPSASLRERIYCASAESELPMAGILLSTGTAGTEGTLGGLVEEGRRFPHHLRRALEIGALCSSDPVCGAHSPQGDFSERFLEGAACHGCLFLAEPSCERFNQFLDRALVVPVLGQEPGLAFFEAP